MNTEKTNDNDLKQGPSLAQRQFSLGEYRVGVTFNPGGHVAVDSLKAKAATFIDECKKGMDETANGEAKRCFAEAMTCMETTAMYAVKGATKPSVPDYLR